MKRLAVRLTTLSLLGAAVLTSLPAFADNMGTAGAANDQITLKSSSDFPSSPGYRCRGRACPNNG